MVSQNKTLQYLIGGFETATDEQIAQLTVAKVGRVPRRVFSDQALMVMVFLSYMGRSYEIKGEQKLYDYICLIMDKYEYSDELISQGRANETLTYSEFLIKVYELLDTLGLTPKFLADYIDYMEKRVNRIKAYMKLNY